MNNWIEFEIEKPRFDEMVLMCRDDNSIGVGEIIKCGNYLRIRFNGMSRPMDSWNRKITHWQWLPAPAN